MEFVLPANESVPFHWSDKKKPQQLCVSFGSDWKWSGGFFIDEIINFAAKLRRNNPDGNDEPYLMPIEIKNEKATLYIG